MLRKLAAKVEPWATSRSFRIRLETKLIDKQERRKGRVEDLKQERIKSADRYASSLSPSELET